ncbi:MAG: shikimate dehydrogenase, partial [Pontimonas sp.]|nr:shikimate dehydrogenase [Pontimonas sp.]
MPSVRPWAAVWGSPIAHSLSPTLHATAYAALGLEWDYRAHEVTVATLPTEFASVGEGVRGLSLTMPLKEGVLEVVAAHETVVDVLGVANTVVFGAEGPFLTNTDPLGVEGALKDADVEVETAWIVGAGATARSVGYALAARGVRDIALVVRDLSRASATEAVLRRLGVNVTVVHHDNVAEMPNPGLVVNTLPGGAEFPFAPSTSLLRSSTLFDVAYHPWPSAGASLWQAEGAPVISGLPMLVHQALHQIRWF